MNSKSWRSHPYICMRKYINLLHLGDHSVSRNNFDQQPHICSRLHNTIFLAPRSAHSTTNKNGRFIVQHRPRIGALAVTYFSANFIYQTDGGDIPKVLMYIRVHTYTCAYIQKLLLMSHGCYGVVCWSRFWESTRQILYRHVDPTRLLRKAKFVIQPACLILNVPWVGLNTEKDRKGPKRTEKDRKGPKRTEKDRKGPKRTEKGPKRTEKDALVYYLPKRRQKVGDRQQNSRQGSIWGK